jgi:hypothetical protein
MKLPLSIMLCIISVSVNKNAHRIIQFANYTVCKIYTRWMIISYFPMYPFSLFFFLQFTLQM